MKTDRRILLVDDHPITRRGIAALINQQRHLTVCGEADSAPRAIELITKLAPDLAIVDISLKSMNGIELIKNIRVPAPHLPVLVLSMHDEALFAERAVRAGAHGYIMKQEASEKILTAIGRVLAGEIYLSEAMKGRMLQRVVDPQARETGPAVDRLSDRELEVLQLIGNGYSTQQMAQRLNLSVKRIESCREHLKEKLRLESGPALAQYAIRWAKSQGI